MCSTALVWTRYPCPSLTISLMESNFFSKCAGQYSNTRIMFFCYLVQELKRSFLTYDLWSLYSTSVQKSLEYLYSHSAGCTFSNSAAVFYPGKRFSAGRIISFYILARCNRVIFYTCCCNSHRRSIFWGLILCWLSILICLLYLTWLPLSYLNNLFNNLECHLIASLFNIRGCSVHFITPSVATW